MLRLDRGGVYLVSHDRATEKLPEVRFATLPFIIGYALRVQSLGAAEAAIDHADLEWRAIEDGIVATFPAELGEGAWFFVERAEALPWRRADYSAGTFSASAGTTSFTAPRQPLCVRSKMMPSGFLYLTS